LSGDCAACGSSRLTPYLALAGDAGPRALIPTTDRFGTALSDIVRCSACGHGQLAAFPTEAELEAAYELAASDEYVEEETGQRATAARILEQVERHRSPGALLDLGCWVGFLLAEARDRGWSPVVGIEPSTFASAYARDRLGLDVRTESLLTADLPAGAFDAVVMGDVIEHLVDPAVALDRIAELLRPDGVVVLMLPDAGSRLARVLGRRWWSVIPTHVQYFTRASLSRLAERRGFRVVHVGTAPKAFTVRYYLERIGGYSPPLSRALVRSARRLGLDDRLWAPDFRDRMLFVATPRPR
jgi:SAM-dependent methyltransferase